MDVKTISENLRQAAILLGAANGVIGAIIILIAIFENMIMIVPGIALILAGIVIYFLMMAVVVLINDVHAIREQICKDNN